MPIRDIALALFVILVWGFNFVAMKWSVAEISPFMLTALRYIGCVLPAIFFIPRPAVSWRLLIIYGTTVGVLQFSFLFSAMEMGMPAGLASLVMQLQVFITTGLAILLLGDRPNKLQIGGALLALAGLAAIGADYIGSAVMIPLIMTLIASTFWSISNIISKRAGKVDMLGFVVWAALIPPIPMLVLAMIFNGPQDFVAVTQLSPLALGSVLFIAYGSTLMGYGGWAILFGRHPASTVAPFSLLVPIVGFAAAYIFLGETFSRAEFIGSAMIFVGLVINVFGPRLLNKRRAVTIS
ncbi:EamA family transporter [Devosia rhodophyticola]|uniref:EamA family transporter n=1 Tax=Devosia rhodophyticola TaxID=3026423 RepID=A0ABY7YSY6_9HYPH|nr:EamA family transporter [Devosia rhodophyticola]WDR04448.1 EamA family transporter [Devosia rhodophyticola]